MSQAFAVPTISTMTQLCPHHLKQKIHYFSCNTNIGKNHLRPNRCWSAQCRSSAWLAISCMFSSCSHMSHLPHQCPHHLKQKIHYFSCNTNIRNNYLRPNRCWSAQCRS